MKIRGEGQAGDGGESDVRVARLFSEEENEDVTMDLMLAMALLPGWEVETATGAIVYDWRERYWGSAREKMRRWGERETNGPVFKQTKDHFTETWTAFLSNKLIQKWRERARREDEPRGDHLSDPHIAKFLLRVSSRGPISNHSPDGSTFASAAPSPLLHNNQC